MRSVGQILAELRENSGLSQRDVAAELCRGGIEVTNQAVCKWENGNSQPNARQFLALCRIYGVRDVLDTFLSLPAADALAGLNDEGRQRAAEYVELLLASGKFAPAPRLRALPLYDLAASAGTGQFLDSSEYELTEVGGEVSVQANFGVRIAGDSMEPRYHDGETVWVQQTQDMASGEIGIFLYNGDAYCKKLVLLGDKAELRSLNPAYEPIKITSELRVFGRVVS